MPHNLYLHSALVKTRNVDRTNKPAVTEANKYFFMESSIALFVSFILNLFVIGVYGNSLYHVTNQEAYDKCVAEGSIYSDIFNVTGK